VPLDSDSVPQAAEALRRRMHWTMGTAPGP